jgi:superfamily II DNA or RNA helicase/diadenosine tetraphosphate (Ap4A) HIT family hydrolase
MSPFVDVPSSEWVTSNELAFAIYDRFPVSPGHVLVVTKRVVPDWWSATEAEQRAVMALVGEVKGVLDARFAPSGYNVGFNAGVSAGQTVPHLHVHVIARYDGDMADPRGGVRHVIPGKGNYLADVPVVSPLVTPAQGRMKLELLRCLADERLDRIDLLVSFVMRSGLDLIAARLDEALARGAHVRLLTTDYLGITDTSALGFFLDRLDNPAGAAGRLSARVFSDPSTSFHPKAYIFTHAATGDGVAFVGSSNLSRSGIEHGVEWNIETRHVDVLLHEFESLWNDPRSVTLTSPWLTDYASRRPQRQAMATHGDAIADETPELPPEPTVVQHEALRKLEQTRLAGFGAGMVVMATGLGKTWLAAFDTTRPEFRRVLFVAHRDEILQQARDVFRRIRPDGSLSFFTGDERDVTGDVVFASVQSLSRHLTRFAPDAFDYIVVDEFHHADAPSYRRTIGHFRPRFLLGLTATPERADRADLLALCADNLVYDCGLADGIERGLLSPFAYRAIRDVADYEHIPWRSGRFDLDALSQQLETQARTVQVFDEWTSIGGAGRRTLAFCCTIRHAEYMADQFRQRDVRAVAVHSGAGSAARSESLDRLAAGELDVIFTVDLFNEGVDVPAIDAVLMLRPTESPVVFFQQLGRGLRRHTGKDRLEVIDLVGNHRSFLLKARLLAELAGRPGATSREAVDLLTEPLTDLPPGCSLVVDTEVVDLLRELTRRAGRDRLAGLLTDWVAEHDGRRPTALEFSLHVGDVVGARGSGGWFGLLDRLGLLSPVEAEVYGLARDFLVEVEFGSFTKSWKLVTLLALLDADSLRSGMPVPDVALAARWLVMRDRRLRNDLLSARGSFADVSRPTEAEWVAYWRKNPINAWTGGNTRGASPWFTVVDGDRLALSLAVPAGLGDTFDVMVREVTEYRLHRYLVGKKRLDMGERRLVRADGGAVLDAEFVVEMLDDRVTVVIESAGGTTGSDGARNTDYVAGLDLVLGRLASIGVELVDVYVDSSVTAKLPVEARRLAVGADFEFPLDLAAADVTKLRPALLRAMKDVGRAAESKGGGNSRKRIRLVLDGADADPLQLADRLAGGSAEASESEGLAGGA